MSGTGKRHFEIPPTRILERYFGEYSTSTKACKIWEVPNPFFHEVAKFLLEVGCVHTSACGMPNQKAGIVIATFRGQAID